MNRDEYNEIQSEFEKFQESYHYLKQAIKAYSPETFKRLKTAFTYINTGIPSCDMNQFLDNCYTLEKAMEDMEDEIEEEDSSDLEEDIHDPQEGDYITEDYRKWYQYGKLVLDLTEEEGEHWRNHIKTHMDKERFWPSVWWISDHGNAHILSLQDESDET